MKKFTNEYADLLYEALEDKVKNQLSDNFLSLKSGILELLENTINDTSELVNVQNFINDYLNEPENKNLNNFIEDNDIFNFYLKYQVDVDEICSDNGFFEEPPRNKNIFSLYEYMIEGTKFAVQEGLKIIQKEVFQ